MIIKRIPKINSINLSRLEEYMRDAKDASPGESHGPKCAQEYTGGLGFISDGWEDRLHEIEALQASYSGNSDPLQHWVMSWPSGEKPTPEQVNEAWEIFSKHQGMQDHQLLFTVHKDSEFLHSHAILNRINPEPTEAGQYTLEWSRGTVGSVQRKSGERHTNQALCAAVAVAEISTRQGWSLLENRKFNWSLEHGHTKHIIDENPDKIRLGSRVETFEALNPGVKHPKRILAETTLQIIREANGDKTLAISQLTAQGITYKDEDYIDNKGRRHIGGVVQIGKDKVKISALPKSDRWIAKLPPVQTPIVIEPVAESIILTHKEDANSSLNDNNVPIDLSKVNEKSIEIQSESPLITEENPIEEPTKPLLWAEKQEVKASMIETASTIFSENALKGRTELEKVLAQADIRIVEATTTINNDGEEKEIKYGQIETQGVTAPLSALGKSEEGKSLYSLSSLDFTEKLLKQEALRNEALPLITKASPQGYQAVADALKNRGIEITKKEIMMKDKITNEEKAMTYTALQRNGVEISLSSLGKTQEGHSLFTENELRRTQLAREAAKVIDASQNWREAKPKFEELGITHSRVKTHGKDGTEYIVDAIEKDGVTTTLSKAGEQYRPAQIDSKYLPYSEARALFEQTRLQKDPVKTLALQGYTAPEIDRVRRVGEKAEAGNKPKEIKDRHTRQKPVSSKNLIPSSMNEILEEILDAALQASQLAKTVAERNRALFAASIAQKEALLAKNALEELRASMQIQEPKETPKVEEKPMETPRDETPKNTIDRDREQIREREKSLERQRELEKEKQRQREREKERERQRQ